MVIFGINPVAEALSSQEARVERITIVRGAQGKRLQEIIDRARNLGVPVHFEPIESLNRRAQSTAHQMVLADLAEIPFSRLDAILERQPRRLLLLDGVEDPRNLGAVLRTAEAAGFGSILLPKRHTCGVTPTVVKTSAGAALHLRIARIGNVPQTLSLLKESGYWVIGLDMRGSEGVERVDLSLPLTVVVGGEHLGLRRLVREKCDFLLRLPMKGQVASLNLSVAAGILLYQLFERDSAINPGARARD